MSWLTPIGFLGLIGLIILIIIYILKPQYQQKFISSTYVWELSLKYKRKKIPINKFRNILLFLCQVLVISICASILAQPIIEEQQAPLVVERVAIIDASANMRTAYDEESRFERAILETTALAKQTFEEEGYFTVIFAGKEAAYMAQRVTSEGAFDLELDLQTLIDEDACTYGEGDIDGAVSLAQKIVDQNIDTEVYLYTATEYLDDGGAVNVVNVSEVGEWNAAILNCEAFLEENYYTFKITLASYNRDADLVVYCEVNGTNIGTVKFEQSVRCDSDQTKTVTFATGNSDSKKVYEFESVRVYLAEEDSFARDNDFFIYGGKKPELNMLYYNPHANTMFGGVMQTVRSNWTDWDVNLTQINSDKVAMENVPIMDYDFYVYEGTMPDILPTDGVVMLVNMDKTPEGLTAVKGQEITSPSTDEDKMFRLTFGDNFNHPLVKYMTPENVPVYKYTRMLNYEGFEPILYCNGDPVVFVKNSDGQKIIMMNISVNFSLVAMYVEFPILMYNILDYFMPATLTDNAFDVNEVISLRARSDELSVKSADGAYDEVIKEFPQQIVLDVPGSYTVSQIPISGKPQVEQFFVKIPTSESDIFQTKESLYELIVPQKKDVENFDLLLYFAIALVAFIFAERLLQARDM